ncbi:hypothetical protein HRUBRA_00408 [Pseudohaliea rubra DSM 19751]|uniref:Uncharacterized protein n=1 Tax=Pseudohaliea rubra DSM 19751 TaxID=1265313 RepID=A0A095VU79_9GAMM|nr:hypothetical protein HRUBRA_00408 [Pseudohaliea rubra DSM 19751]
MDAAGNIIATRRGTNPQLLASGSHISFAAKGQDVRYRTTQ